MSLTPLSRKLTLLLGAVTAIALLTGGIANAALEYFAIRRSIVQELRSQAEVVGYSAGMAMAFEDPLRADVELSNLKATRRVLKAALYTPQGQVYAVYPHQLKPADFPPLPRPGAPLLRFEGERLDLFAKIEVADGVSSHIYLQGDMHELRPRVLFTLKVQGLILAVVFGLVLLLALRLQRTLSDPLLRLVESVERVGARRDYDVRVEPEGGSLEIYRLGEGFNHMIEAVQERDMLLVVHQNRLEEEVSARTEELRRVNGELLSAKNRAEDASRAKSAFLANMSHELRTPLNAVLLYSELLRHEVEDDGLMKYLPDIQTIHGAGRHLLGLIDGVLDLSRIETGRMDLGSDQADLAELAARLAQAAAPLMAKQANELRVHVAEGLPPLHTDAKKLQTILAHLLENAAKFTQRGRVELNIAPVEGRVRFEVRDTGIGMAAGQVARIFGGFTQADESSTRRFGGLGLGLTLCQKFTQLLGGTLRVESREGEGTRVLLDLPTKPPSPVIPMRFVAVFTPGAGPGAPAQAPGWTVSTPLGPRPAGEL